jgi:hypothetical protein
MAHGARLKAQGEGLFSILKANSYLNPLPCALRLEPKASFK